MSSYRYVLVLNKTDYSHIGWFKVLSPSQGDKGFYPAAESESSFFNPRILKYGKTKDANVWGTRAVDKNPSFRFHRHYENDFEIFNNISVKMIRELTKNFSYYSDTKIFNVPSLWCFYDLIGWNKKAKKFDVVVDMNKFFSDLPANSYLTWDKQ